MRNLDVEVRGAREDVVRAEKVIRDALTAAGYGVDQQETQTRAPLRLIEGGRSS